MIITTTTNYYDIHSYAPGSLRFLTGGAAAFFCRRLGLAAGFRLEAAMRSSVSSPSLPELPNKSSSSDMVVALLYVWRHRVAPRRAYERAKERRWTVRRV